MATLNECNHIITIKYLEAFANGVIQDSNGNIINVNRNALPSSARTDGYCPTYSMLTGGTLVQNHKANSVNTPNDDVDGIIIKGSYAANQCVKQEDMSLRYTRHSGLTISADTTSIGPCDCISCVTLSYDNKYKITERTLSACSSTAYKDSTSAITDTVNREIIWGKNGQGTITYPKFSMPQNGEVSSNTRTTTISAITRFRNTDISSVNSITVTQAGLTGEYVYWREYRRPKTLTAQRLTDENFPCSGGTAKANAVGTYDVHNVSIWTDVCGNQYPNKTKDEVVREETETLPTIENTFAEHKCPDTTCSDRWTARFDWGGLTASIDFTQNGTIQCCKCDDLSLSPMALDWAWSDTSSSAITVTSAACISNITVPTATHFNVSVSGGKITITPKGQNTTASAYEDEITISYKADSLACSKKILAVQQAKGICPCSCVVVTKASVVTFDKTAQSVKLGTVTSTCSTDICQDAITFEPSPGLSNVHMVGNDVYGDLSATEINRMMTCKVKASGTECSELKVYQRCFRGTDNGNDWFYDETGAERTELHPIRMCGGMKDGHYDHDADAIYVPGVQIQKPNGQWEALSALTGTNKVVYDGWLEVNYKPSDDTSKPCSYGSISGTALSANETNDIRMVAVNLKSEELDLTICGGEWVGKIACSAWTWDVWQAPTCHGWCRMGDRENREIGVYDVRSQTCAEKYADAWNRAIAAGETAVQDNCGAPGGYAPGCIEPGGCTSGNISGLVGCVSSAATSNAIQIGTWTKNPTTCPQVWSYNSSQPLVGSNFLDLSTLRFDNDGKIYAKVRETNPTTSPRQLIIPLMLGSTAITANITVTQCAGSTPTTCAVTLELIGAAPGAGSSTQMYVGRYNSVGSCTKPTTLDFVSGQNILSDISINDAGGIYAKISANPSTTASRSGVYRVTYGSATATATITQLANNPTPPTPSTPCAANSSVTGSVTANSVSSIGMSNIQVGTYGYNCDNFVNSKLTTNSANLTLGGNKIYLTTQTNDTGADRNINTSVYYDGVRINNTYRAILQPYNYQPTIAISAATVNSGGGGFPIGYSMGEDWQIILVDGGDLITYTDVPSTSCSDSHIKKCGSLNISAKAAPVGTVKTITVVFQRRVDNKFSSSNVKVTWI